MVPVGTRLMLLFYVLYELRDSNNRLTYLNLDSFRSDVALYCSYVAVICLSFYVLFLILFYLCAIAIRSYDHKFQINTYLLSIHDGYYHYVALFILNAIPLNDSRTGMQFKVYYNHQQRRIRADVFTVLSLMNIRNSKDVIWTQ